MSIDSDCVGNKFAECLNLLNLSEDEPFYGGEDNKFEINLFKNENTEDINDSICQ